MELEHGGRLDAAIARYGGKRNDWLDLSTGINPNAWPVPQLPHACWQLLPDDEAEQSLLEAAGHYYGVRPDHRIIAANGTQSLIEILPRIFSFGRIGIVSPCYREHVHAWAKYGNEPIEFGMGETIPDGVRALVVVNPNNPDAQIVPLEILKRWQKIMADRRGLLILDEAFADPLPSMSFVPHMDNNTIILRSFGKFFGLAGLRLGFAICSQTHGARLRKALGPWAVSGPALLIGRKAFEDQNWIERTRNRLFTHSDELAETLTRNGLLVDGKNPLFVLARHSDAKQIAERLADHHILVRPFGELPHHLRFGLCKSQAELQRLDRSLGDVMARSVPRLA